MMLLNRDIITVMVYVLLVGFGLILGSFINALVWRLREQELLLEKKPKGIGKQLRKLSIVHGRSMCTHCSHLLAPMDLVPVLSWVWLRGKCRYCSKPINDTPFTEVMLPLLFIVSYVAWPYASNGWTTLAIVGFSLWSAILTCLLALAVYDAKWFILPDKLVLPVTILSFGLITCIAYDMNDWTILLDSVVAGLGLFGLFYALFLLSNERWIGGGDVKLAASLGLLAGSLFSAMLLLFIASLAGTLLALPGIIGKKYTAKSVLPFGPFLISAAIIVVLWGDSILDWYLGLL